MLFKPGVNFRIAFLPEDTKKYLFMRWEVNG